jgi:predicted esterase
MVPDRPSVQYNLACVFALNGDTDEAVHWLGRSAASGFHNLDQLDRDRDLDSVRDQPGYSAVRAAIAENSERAKDELRRAARAAPPIIVPPDGHDPRTPAPLILALHGYGDRAENFPRLWQGAAAKFGAILVVPRAVRPVGNGFSWGSVNEADTIVQMTLEYVKSRLAVDEKKIVISGFSQGGFMAMAVGLRHPDLFAGVIAMAGGYIPEVDAPLEAGPKAPRYYFMAGDQDRAVKAAKRASRDFKAAGYRVKLRVLLDTGHTFPKDRERELGRALRFVLGE